MLPENVSASWVHLKESFHCHYGLQLSFSLVSVYIYHWQLGKALEHERKMNVFQIGSDLSTLQYRSNVSWQSLETRTTRLDPWSSKLENLEYRVSSRVIRVSSQVVRVSSRVVRVSSRVVRVLSRGDKEFIARLIFPNACTYHSCWFTFGDREIFESRL